MNITVARVPLKRILAMRELYRREMNCQIIHDSHHARGFTGPYLIRLNGRVVGYGCVAKGRPLREGEIKEFYVLPADRGAALPLFRRFAAASRAREVTAQTNDRLLTLMLFDCARRIKSETILFHDAITTHLVSCGATFRKVTKADKEQIFRHRREPEGDWVIAVGRKIVATGGIMFHYNPPYGDLHLEVAPAFRRRGYGSYLIQELKRACYRMGKVPAARCDAANVASRATLQRAGMFPCARVLNGVL